MRCAAIIAVAILPLVALAQPGQEPLATEGAPADRGGDLMERLIQLTDEQPREHRIIIGQLSFEGGRLKIHDGPAGPPPMRREIQRVLNDGQPIVGLILEGAQLRRLDLGLPPGPMPADAAAQFDDSRQVLSSLRQAYRLLRLDIMWRLEHGALDSAVKRIEGGLGFCAAIDDDAQLLVHMTRGSLGRSDAGGGPGRSGPCGHHRAAPQTPARAA